VNVRYYTGRFLYGACLVAHGCGRRQRPQFALRTHQRCSHGRRFADGDRCHSTAGGRTFLAVRRLPTTAYGRTTQRPGGGTQHYALVAGTTLLPTDDTYHANHDYALVTSWGVAHCIPLPLPDSFPRSASSFHTTQAPVTHPTTPDTFYPTFDRLRPGRHFVDTAHRTGEQAVSPSHRRSSLPRVAVGVGVVAWLPRRTLQVWRMTRLTPRADFPVLALNIGVTADLPFAWTLPVRRGLPPQLTFRILPRCTAPQQFSGRAFLAL